MGRRFFGFLFSEKHFRVFVRFFQLLLLTDLRAITICIVEHFRVFVRFFQLLLLTDLRAITICIVEIQGEVQSRNLSPCFCNNTKVCQSSVCLRTTD